MKQENLVAGIYEEIIKGYPFLSKSEQKKFEDEAKLILLSNKNEFEKISELLKLLNNPHADIRPSKEEKDRKPPQEPKLKIENRVAYIRVFLWDERIENLAGKLISFCKENEDKYEAIIIDVRDNGGGMSNIAHKFAGIFFKDEVNFGKLIKRVKGEGLIERFPTLEPNGDIYINKPLAILTSNKCFSSNELFIAPFKVSGRATLIGEKTFGGSGNPSKVYIEVDGKKYKVRIPTWRFILKGETKPIEETKIEPDIYYDKKDIIIFAQSYLTKHLS